MEISMASRKSPVTDANLIPRVKQYLEENVHKTYVDVDEMTQSLMTRYVEYSRRKSIPFKIAVEHAYKTVLHSYGLDSNPGSEEEAGSDLEVMDDANGRGNHLNNALTNMYLKKTANPVSSTEDAAAISIDISSDEEDGGKKEDPGQQFDKLKSVTIKAVTSSTPAAPAANGNKLSNEHINDLMGKMRPGPASQKKRRIEAMEDALQPPAKQQPPSSQQLPVPAKAPKKKFKKEVFAKFPSVTFEDIGGLDKTLKDLCELILHIKHPEMYKHIGLPPPRGFLLNGPPGSGKTLLAHAIAGQLDVLLVEVQATELVAGVSGESEERIREIFEQAASFAPCVLFIDEIDAISSNRQNAQKDMERRIVAQLLASLDGLSKFRFGDQVLVIGATNRPEALDPALRRVGRFDHEISLGIPDRTARAQILNIIAGGLKLERPFDFDEVAKLTPGYVGADLLALATRAASNAIKRVMTEKEQTALENSLKPVPIVNLDDDSLLMDVDSEEKKGEEEKKEEEKPAEEKEKPVEENDKPAEEKEKPAEGETEIKEAPAAPEIPEPAPEVVTETPMETEEAPKQEEAPVEPQKDPKQELEDMKPEMKLHLTLGNMIKWLASDIQPMTDHELEKLLVTRDDFLAAVKVVQPSAKREGFITVPDVTWDDVGWLQDIRAELKLAILAPVKFPEKLKKLGLQSPSGVLLCGPPGCGKTLLAKAVANEAGINFISVKGPELLNMYVGESERAVRQCFQRARNSAPCVIFFDEFDSLCPKRSDSGENSSQRVVNQLLTEMDGIEGRVGVFLMAATNRPDIVDPAVMRPGRLDKILYVGLPERDGRVDILKALTKGGTKPELAEDVDFLEIADLTDGYTGADLAGLVRQASLQTLKESIDGESDSTDDLKVRKCHFVDAIKVLKPSVGEQDIKHYAKLKEKYGSKKD